MKIYLDENDFCVDAGNQDVDSRHPGHDLLSILRLNMETRMTLRKWLVSRTLRLVDLFWPFLVIKPGLHRET